MSSKLPARLAGPQEIRDYIFQVIVSKHDALPDFASKIASHWQLGRGSDFRDAQSDEFEKIFGVNPGLCIFRSVREDEDNGWYESPKASMIYCKSF